MWFVVELVLVVAVCFVIVLVVLVVLPVAGEESTRELYNMMS